MGLRTKGAAFLHTRTDFIEMTVPTVISHGYNTLAEAPQDRYRVLFDWLGTDDFSAWAVIPDVLSLVGGLEAGGWDAVMKRNHELALEGRHIIAGGVRTDIPAPAEMVGSMAAVLLPDLQGPNPGGDLSPLMDELMGQDFVTLIMNWPQWLRQLLRVSAHLCNTPDEFRSLAEFLRTETVRLISGPQKLSSPQGRLAGANRAWAWGSVRASEGLMP